MTRNPHEIVTLDDQPDNEGPSRYLLACGCALDGPEYHCKDCGLRHPHHNPNCYWARNPSGLTDDDIPRKPMRLRYMELPGEINPNTNELTTPFVIVIDRAGNNYDGDFDDIAIQTGARGTLLFRSEVQIGDD